MPFQQADSSIVPAAPSPACPLRMFDWTSLENKKEQPASPSPIIPHHPARTIEHLQTPHSSHEPRSLVPTALSSYEDPGPLLRRRTCPVDCSHKDTHTHTSHSLLTPSRCNIAADSPPPPLPLHPHSSFNWKLPPAWSNCRSAHTTGVTGPEQVIPLIAN